MTIKDNNAGKNLVEMFYFREGSPEAVKSAVVTEKQAYDIKVLLSHIHVLKVIPAPYGKIRDYILM